MKIKHALLQEKGYRTPDLYEIGKSQIKVGTKEITEKIIEE